MTYKIVSNNILLLYSSVSVHIQIKIDRYISTKVFNIMYIYLSLRVQYE